MNYFMKKEIDNLKGDVKASEIQLEVEKYAFERKLLNGEGDEIIKYLNNPPKQNWFLGIKMKFKRWHQKHKEKKEYKKIIKELDKINNNFKKELGGF